MLSPQVSSQLKQLLTLYQKGIFVEQEFSLRLASLVSRENALDMLDALPAEAIPWLKEALVEAAQNAVDADYLCPEESIFQENVVNAAYYLRVAVILLERTATRPRAGLTMVCLPSFEVEWALRVCSSAKIGFTAILTEPEEKIWAHANPHSIQVHSKQRALDPSLGEALCEVWKKALVRTRHPRRARLGLDGVSYHFVYSGVAVGNRAGHMAGHIWSPDKDSLPGKLVAISHTARAYVKASEEGASQTRRELDGCIAEFNSLVGQNSQSPA